MTCDRCFQLESEGEHGVGLCPYEPRKNSPSFIGDELPGGARMFENLGEKPVYISSKSQLRSELAARGLKPMVRHVGTKDGDRSANTTRWI